MGSRTDVAELLSQCRWSEEGSYLGEIAKSSGFPCVAKVSRGQYVGLGQPSFSNPSLVSHVLLVSAGKQLSVVAQCVKFKNARQRVVPYGPTLVIPQDFDGHFEILNEDGKAVPCIETVEALARRFPDSCLVREAFKANKPDAKSIIPLMTKDPDGPPSGLLQNTNYRISDKTRVVQPGEILVLVGEVSVPTGKNKVNRYLRCFDSQGQTVFLAASQKGKFSPLARQESISGVHTTKNILNKRMPLMVRLVDGKPPVMPSAKSSSFKFVPELRLYCTLQEELIFGMPLSQSSKEIQNIIPMPMTVPLKFQVCRNMTELEQTKEFSRVYEKVKTLVQHSKNFIQIYDINLKKELRFDGRQWKSYAPPIFLTPSATTADLEIIPTNNSNNISSNNNGCSSDSKLVDPSSSPNYNEIPEMQDYEDIDQIYDYVRGIKPPPARLLVSSQQQNNSVNTTTTATNTPTGGGDLSADGNNCSQQQKNSKKILQQHQSVENKESSKPKGAPTTVVTITSSPSPGGGPDVIANVNCIANSTSVSNCNSHSSNNYNNVIIPPPVPKHRSSNHNQLLRPSKSVEKLIDDDRPPPPPIETIPSLQNKFHILQNQPVSSGINNGLSISVSNNCSKQGEKKLTSKTQIELPSSYDDNKINNNSGHNHHHLHQGTQIQIQIRSENNKKIAELKNIKNNSAHHHHYSNSNSHSHAHQNGNKIISNGSNSSSPTPGVGLGNNGNNNIIITTTNIGHGHSHHNNHKLDSTGGSISTSGTPTNTSGSGSSSQSKSSCGEKGRLITKPKTHLYIKHNSKESGSNNNNVGGGGGPNNLGIVNGPAVLSTDPNGNGLSGSPTNRIIFRRSPIFDCRYKSMNDLNRSSLESGASVSSPSVGGSGSSSQRLKYFQHNHHNNVLGGGISSNVYSNGLVNSRDNYLGSSQTNLNLNLMNLNLNLKASAKHKGIFRPKSLTNIALDDGLSNGLVFGGSSSSNHNHSYHHLNTNGNNNPMGAGGFCGGVKKKLADMVVPSHHHAIHTPPPPPIELLQKIPLKSSQRNSRNSRKGSINSPNLFL